MVAKVKATGEKIRVRVLKNGTFSVFNSNKVYTKDDLIFPSTDKKEFLKDLKELLEKYNACISWACDDGSDLYGIYNDHICVTLDNSVEINFEGSCVDCDDCDIKNIR